MQRIWSAIIVEAPASLTDSLKVTIPDLHPDLVVSDVRWNSTTSLPQAGDECLIIFDNDRAPWVVAWWPPSPVSPGVALPHHVTHEPGGSDTLAVDAAVTVGSLRTIGTGATQAAAGNDPRFAPAGLTPIGAISDWPWASSQIPSGWMMPYGQPLTQAAGYTALVALGNASGFPYGGSAGVSVTLPDYRGRVAAGLDNMGGTALGLFTLAICGSAGATLGGISSKFGSEGVLLTTGQLPAHQHGGVTGNDSPDHTHSGTSGNDSPDHAHGGTTDGENTDHSHGFSTGGISANHQHLITVQRSAGYGLTAAGPGFAGNVAIVPGGGGTDVSYNSGYVTSDHSHSGGTGGRNVGHTHTFSTGGRSVFHQHPFTSAGASARHTHSIPLEGSGLAHSSVQPTIVVNKIMRVL